MLHRLGLFGGRGSAGTTSARVPDPVAALGPVWGLLPPGIRADVREPVRRLTREGRQTDATTCGSAVLVMLAAAGDPVLALWLAAGLLPQEEVSPTWVGAAPGKQRLPREHAAGGSRRVRPPELVAAPPDRLAALADVPVRARFAVLQRVVKHRTNTAAMLGLTWPASLGTPPWGAARVARFGGLRFGHRVVDDTDPVHLTDLLRDVDGALARGVPVPLYTGGDTARGWSTAVPRHVVLAVPDTPSDDSLTVWEPSVGRMLSISRTDLAVGAPHPALGGWSHLTWAILPTS